MLTLGSCCFCAFKPHPYYQILDAWHISRPSLVEPILWWFSSQFFLVNLAESYQVLSKYVSIPKAQWKSHMVPLLGLGLQIFHGLRCPLALVEKASDRLRRRLWRCLYLVVRDGEQPVTGRKICGVNWVWSEGCEQNLKAGPGFLGRWQHASKFVDRQPDAVKLWPDWVIPVDAASETVHPWKPSANVLQPFVHSQNRARSIHTGEWSWPDE